MPKSRRSQICLSDTRFYHCTSRCVRQSFLCGNDYYTGKSYEHRRQWVEDRLMLLASVFAINVCSYAVMSNHSHVVLHVNKELAESWSDREVLIRWHRLYKGTTVTQKFVDSKKAHSLSEFELDDVLRQADLYRNRLYDISWFMRNLNEYIAKEANKEDGCTGHFWEGRFKSQALLDDTALLTCMAYVDLNPIRAKMAPDLLRSDHTSIKRRLERKSYGTCQDYSLLMPFCDEIENVNSPNIPFSFPDYVQLVQETGIQVASGKRGVIEKIDSKLLENLSLQSKDWLVLSGNIEKYFSHVVGTLQCLKDYQRRHSVKRMVGIKGASMLQTVN